MVKDYLLQVCLHVLRNQLQILYADLLEFKSCSVKMCGFCIIVLYGLLILMISTT